MPDVVGVGTVPDSPAVRAFDAVASTFDERYGAWASVAAQRRAVRRELLRAFAPGTSLLELGGGTGEDALFLAAHGRRVVMTDGAPGMLERAQQKAEAAGLTDLVKTRLAVLEQFDDFVATSPSYDGAFSNFAALNCVSDLVPVARGLAHLLPPGTHALLVLFGPFAPGEVVVQLGRGDVRAAFRRLSRGDVPARLAGRSLAVRYPSPRAVARAFAPWFELTRIRGIGVFVPPSAAEPVISRFPRLLRVLEAVDQVVAAPMAWFGDHVLLDFRRTATKAHRRERGGC